MTAVKWQEARNRKLSAWLSFLDSTPSLNNISRAAASLSHRQPYKWWVNTQFHTSINWTDQCCVLITLTNSVCNECIRWWPVASPSRDNLCQALLTLQLVTPCVDASMCVFMCERERQGRKREVLMPLVCMWWDISLSTKTAPQNWFSPRCQKGHKPTHTLLVVPCFKHTEALKCVLKCVCTCVSESVTPLWHCGLKAFQLKSKHCSKYKREAEEQKQTHTARQGGFNATEAEWANREERRAAQTATQSRDRN